MSDFQDGTYEIIGCAMAVHRELGSGLREKPYENALIIALREEGFAVEPQRSYPIYFRSHIVGDCIPDLTINREILIEIKAVDSLGENETAQTLNYLRISGLKLGLVINFKPSKLEWKRCVM
ncbi:MAG: GxxExxY protein [Verrucomicrobiae bacterium]|nr:GxxExxY protein [Verrucomicrobiae bacterium]